MAESDQFIGNAGAWRALETALRNGKPAQAYLFEGPEHIGKTTLALKFAAEILGVQTIQEVFGHPDFLFLGEDKCELSTAAVRDLQKNLSLYPYSAAHKVAILAGVEEASLSAANALLKALEEPVPSSVLILLTSDLSGVLATIKSRCQIMSLRPVPQAVLQKALLSRHPAGEKIVELSFGLPGLALTYAENPEMLEAALNCRQLAEKIDALGVVERLRLAENQAGESRAQVLISLSGFIAMFRAKLLGGMREGSQEEVRRQQARLVVAVALREEVLRGQVNLRLALENFYLNL